MLWSTVVQSGTPRQAETTIEAKNPGRAGEARARRRVAGARPAPRGLSRAAPTAPRRAAPGLPPSSSAAESAAMTRRGSASGSYASASDHRLCPGRTSTLAAYRPGAACPACEACAAVASAIESAPMASADTPATTHTPAPGQPDRGSGRARSKAHVLAPPRAPAPWPPLAYRLTIVTMSTTLLKRLFDHTPVRSRHSSIERTPAIFVPLGSDNQATRRTDVW